MSATWAELEAQADAIEVIWADLSRQMFALRVEAHRLRLAALDERERARDLRDARTWLGSGVREVG